MALKSKIFSPFSKILPSLCLPVLDFIFISSTHEGSLVLRWPKDLTFLQILKKNIGQYAIVWQHFIKRVPRHDLNLLKYNCYNNDLVWLVLSYIFNNNNTFH